jgi:hypothetical protein
MLAGSPTITILFGDRETLVFPITGDEAIKIISITR